MNMKGRSPRYMNAFSRVDALPATLSGQSLFAGQMNRFTKTDEYCWIVGSCVKPEKYIIADFAPEDSMASPETEPYFELPNRAVISRLL